MKNKKIILLFILVLLISIFGVSFALYNYNKTSKNSKLIVGDIYMHYKGSNEAILTTAEDTSNFYYEGYLLNPNMKNQEYQELDTRNELTKCADYFKDGDYIILGLISFCKNEAVEINGNTFQFQSWINNNSTETQISELKKLNVVLEDNTVNPIMSSQEYVDTDTRNELSKCMELSLFAQSSFDSNSTIETFCKGTGTIKGKTLQDGLDEWQSAGFKANEYLEARNIITSDNKVNPIMATQTYEEKQEVIDTRNEMSKCTDYFYSKLGSEGFSKIEGKSYKNDVIRIAAATNAYTVDDYKLFCQGTGTIDNNTLQYAVANLLNDDIKNDLIDMNVIYEKKGILSEIDTINYVVNPEIKNQSYQEDTRNELTLCANYLYNKYGTDGISYMSNYFKNNNTRFMIMSHNYSLNNYAEYCKGNTTIRNYKFQDALTNSKFNENDLNYLANKNIISKSGDTYVINSNMANQTYQENDTRNELSRCVDYFYNNPPTINTGKSGRYMYNIIKVASGLPDKNVLSNFCKGTGTNDGTNSGFNINTLFSNSEVLKILKENNIAISQKDHLPYFEFTIDGKNTSNKDINYNIKLAHGDVIENKTENNRLMDKYLIFKLVEVINNEEVELVDNIKYDNINNNIIYKNIISKNTNEEINHTYRLYMIVDPNLMIGNLEGAVYSFEEYANLFASIKVNVDGNYE